MKFYQIPLLVMVWAVNCIAIPASNETFNLEQPDGSIIEARYVGDDRFHVLETEDGYILQKDVLGYYAYVDETGKSSGIYARNAQNRSISDMQFLAQLSPKAIYQKMLAETPLEESLEYGIPKFAYPKIQRMPTPNTKLTQGEPHALVLLVQFSDIKFKNADPQKQFTDYLNKEGYNEYHHQGSARDYFIKNSMGAFRPTFDVIGPITVSKTRASYGGTSSDRNYAGAKNALLEALDTLLRKYNIDYSKYDNDNNGVIDFVYMIYAGVGRASSGVVESIWPHAGYTSKTMTNNLRVSRYACSNEISGRSYSRDKETTNLDGIGTFVHEFSHVLGLPDLYDLKGANTRKTPQTWSVMAQGCYNCPSNSDNIQSCSPPLYSAFERMSVGWMPSPIELNTKGQVQLNKIDDNIAFSVTNPKNSDEMFLLEYRTRKNWDAGQVGSGMLIWHIDYVASVWSGQNINTNSSHMYVDIEEAVPETSTSASAADAFPGSGKVTEFKKFIFWNGDSMKIALSNITESTDKEYVTFDVDMTVTSSPSMSSSSNYFSSAYLSSSSTVSSSSIAQSSSSRWFWFFSSSSVTSSSSEFALSSSSIAQSSSSRWFWFFSSSSVTPYSSTISQSSSSRWFWFFSSSSVMPYSSSISQSSSSQFWFISSSSVMPYSSSIMQSSSSQFWFISSSSVMPYSSSILQSSSSQFWFISSSSVASSSSEFALSSSSIAPYSSSVILTSSSSEQILSSAIESSSSEVESSSSLIGLSSSEISSSSQFESSSSVFILSSSSIAPSSSSVILASSSSEQIFSSAVESSSSEAESSSSHERPVFATTGTMPYRAYVTSQDRMIHVLTPVQGTKNIRIFSPNGQLMFETRMDGTSYQFLLPHQLGKQNVILSVTQGKKTLFMGMVKNKF